MCEMPYCGNCLTECTPSDPKVMLPGWERPAWLCGTCLQEELRTHGVNRIIDSGFVLFWNYDSISWRGENIPEEYEEVDTVEINYGLRCSALNDIIRAYVKTGARIFWVYSFGDLERLVFYSD